MVWVNWLYLKNLTNLRVSVSQNRLYHFKVHKNLIQVKYNFFDRKLSRASILKVSSFFLLFSIVMRTIFYCISKEEFLTKKIEYISCFSRSRDIKHFIFPKKHLRLHIVIFVKFQLILTQSPCNFTCSVV